MRGMVIGVVCAVLCFAGFIEGKAAEWYVSGDVSGMWVSGDTYFVTGDLRVPIGNALSIEPGVQVLFEGLFAFRIEGLLEAKGTRTDPVVFSSKDPLGMIEWQGLRFDGADSGSFLDRCLIEYARSDGAYPYVMGGGVWIDNCSPTIRNCRIRNNESRNATYNGAGGGICVNNACFSVIERNIIYDNTADSGGGIFVGADSKPVIRCNVIEKNTAYYAGGGIYVAADAEALIDSNTISGNLSHGWGGGGINLWSATWLYGTFSTVCNNVIFDNTAVDAGGGIYSRYETSLLYNNSIVRNQAVRGGGIYVLTYSSFPPHMCNTIVWDNSATTDAQIHLDPAATSAINVNFCNVMGSWPGTGNMDADPQFVHIAGGDLHLTYPSPCRDAGDTNLSGLPALDVDGDPRCVFEGADMGADEFCTRLYCTGDFQPCGLVRGRLVGLPDTNPVGLFLGADILDPPWPTKWGELFIAPPWEVIAPLGSIPSNGVMTLHATLPSDPIGAYCIPMQAIIGNELTPLVEMQIYPEW